PTQPLPLLHPLPPPHDTPTPFNPPPRRKPQFDHIIAPVIAEPSKGLEDRHAAIRPGHYQASRMQRRTGASRCQMHDLYRRIECDSRGNVEYEAVAEESSIEGGKRPPGIRQRRLNGGQNTTGPLRD